MKYFFVVGEKSGDMHAANLANALKEEDDSAQLMGWGGGTMQQAGINVSKNYNSYNTMGFVEVIKKLPSMVKLLKQATAEIIAQQADAVILVDFSGFNLRLAKRLKKANYTGKIFYYISPKLWAWNAKRVEKVKENVDAMFCILPFEIDFYKDHGYNNTHYIGNPLMDQISAFTPNNNFLQEKNLEGQNIIALLPGSRENEIKKLLAVMTQVAERFADYKFVIAGVEQHKALYTEITQGNLVIVYNQTYDLLVNAKAAIVASGTATLETALLNVPQISGYAGNTLSVALAKRLVKVKYITLPNLIMSKAIISELIQQDWNFENLSDELVKILEPNGRSAMLDDYAILREKVGPAGASQKAAGLMKALLS